MYIKEWIDSGSIIYGVGPDINGIASKLPMNLRTGLYTITKDVELLKLIMSRIRPTFNIYDTGKIMDSNHFSIFDLLNNNEIGEGHLIKIKTDLFDQSKALMNYFKYNAHLYKYICVPYYWDAHLQIFMDRMILTGDTTPIINKWMDDSFTIHNYKDPIIPIITFDIETVSSDAHKVPTGEDIDDELFSVSIHQISNNKLYSLIYIPIENENVVKLKTQLLTNDEYKTYDDIENIMEVFSTEKDLLIRTLSLLHMNGKYHYLIGYNSTNYDIKYLLMRCHFYQIETNNFVYNNGFMYTKFQQMHIDLFKVVMMRYKFSNYTLKNVSTQLLKTTKEDVDAVKIRYTFHVIRHKKEIQNHDAYDALGIPSIRDIIVYNNIDTLLVSKLIDIIGVIEFVDEYTGSRGMNISSVNYIYNKMQYKILMECFVIGLKKNIFLSNFKSEEQNINFYTEDEMFVHTLDLSKQLNDTTSKTSKYPGGINYCNKEVLENDVQVYDYRIAYPLIIERCNLSDETCSIVPANYLLSLFDKLKNKELFNTYDYLIHAGSNKTVTKLIIHNYIYKNDYCGGEFKFCKEELEKRNDRPVIIVWHGKRGILSQIIEYMNIKRESTKNKRKILDGLIELLENGSNSIQDMLKQMNGMEIEVSDTVTVGDDFNDDDDDDDDDDFGGIAVTEDEPESTEIDTIDLSTCIFNFCDQYLQVYENGSSYLNKQKLLTLNDSISYINEKKKIVLLERDKAESEYMLLKSCIASVYGILGSIAAPLAASVTCLIRTFLLKSCQFFVSKGYEVMYADTDSIFVLHPSVLNFSNELNILHPFTDIEKKVIQEILFFKTKTYFYINDDGKLIYSQHKHGPDIWNQFVQFIYGKNFKYISDVGSTFYEYFELVYNTAKLEDFLVDVKLKTVYETNTPNKLLKEYLIKNYPTLSGSLKHKIYYHLDETDAIKICFRPDFELQDISQINLFKFFMNVFKTVYHIINTSMKKNNKDLFIFINEANVRNIMLNSFISLYIKKYKNISVKSDITKTDSLSLTLYK